ncbi:hypothetical protein ACPSL3_05095 [Vibrio owensii]|uniref:hypothetical protein n=1 Tax=Vibrio owensii TaxID=696485 RepID=UPI00221FC913|nr:hypothetical protein [Vibrio owensii]
MIDKETLIPRALVIAIVVALIALPSPTNARTPHVEQCSYSAKQLATSPTSGEIDEVLYQLLLDKCFKSEPQ